MCIIERIIPNDIVYIMYNVIFFLSERKGGCKLSITSYYGNDKHVTEFSKYLPSYIDLNYIHI